MEPVLWLQKFIMRLKPSKKRGRKTIIIGDHGHDEVVAIAAQVEKPIIISNVDEAHKMRKVKRAGDCKSINTND